MKTDNLIVLGIFAFFAIVFAGCIGPSNITAKVYVQDETGKYISDAFVTVYKDYAIPGNSWKNISGAIVASGKTNNAGYADFELPMAGNYAFLASKDGYETNGKEQTIGMGTNSVIVTLKSTTTPVNGDVKISVVDDEGNLIPKESPLLFAYTYCKSGDLKDSCYWVDYTQVQSNPVVDYLKPGFYRMYFRSKGYEDGKLEFTLLEGQYYTGKVKMAKLNQQYLSKSISMPFNATPGKYELDASLFDGVGNYVAFDNSTFPNLFSGEIYQKVNNSTTKVKVVEQLAITADAKYSNGSLVASIGPGDFGYQVSFTPEIDFGKSKFEDTNVDDVTVVFFGEKYVVNRARLADSRYLQLVKYSSIETFKEGEYIDGLVGDGKYAGMKMRAKVLQVVETGLNKEYKVTLQLFDDLGILVDTQTVGSGSNLKDYFRDKEYNTVLASDVYIDKVARDVTTKLGYIEVVKNPNIVELYDGKIYPYRSGYTGPVPYSVLIKAEGNKLKSIKIINNAEKWEETKTGYDLGALYPTNSDQSVPKNLSKEAVFGQSLPEGTLGKGIAKVEFKGFKDKYGKEVEFVVSSRQ